MEIEEIKKLIDSKKINQSEIAKIAGVTQPTISRWINGETTLKTEAYKKLEKYLVEKKLITPSFAPPILFSVSEKKPHQSEADAQLLALSEKEKEIALSFIKYLKDNKII